MLLWRALHPRLPTDARRDLLLDAAHVHLEQGFADVDALFAWNDAKVTNPDRDEIAIPVRRSSRLLWDVGGRGGRLVLGAARLVLGAAADDRPCELVVSTPGPPAASVVLDVPPCLADAAASTSDWREGPAGALHLDLPPGATSVEIESRSGAVPDDLALALLSPHIEQPPLMVPASELQMPVPVAQRLLPLVPAASGEAPVVFALRQRAGGAGGAGGAGVSASPPEEVTVSPVEALAAFSGNAGLRRPAQRPAIVFTGDAALELTLDVPAASALVGSLALDARLPPGTSATLQVLIDGAPVASEKVDNARWREISVDLAAHAGPGRKLGLRVVQPTLPQQSVTSNDDDFQLGTSVKMLYTAQRVRLGFANPRVQQVESVPVRTASPQRPSVVIVQVETLRADVLPFLGGDLQDLAPNLAAFAHDSVVWERAMTPSSWTLPTTASVLTGLLPLAHGAVDHDRLVLPGDVPTLAERASRAGIATGAVLASDILRPQAGFDRGFGTFAHVPYANARQVDALAEGFLENHVDQQFLLFLHCFDPHSPYNAPAGWRDRYCEPALAGQDVHAAEMRLVDALRRGETPAADSADLQLLRARYRGEIAWFDSQFGRLLGTLQRLGIADRTLVVLTADHGEEFMEHGLVGHGSNLFDETLHVPLLVRGLPGKGGGPQKLLGGTRLPGVVSTASLCASVLQWLDVDFDRGALWPPLDRAGPCAFSETSKGLALDGKGDPLRRYLARVRSDTHSLLWRKSVPGEEGKGSYALYDLRSDPGELHPLDAGQSPGPDLRRCFDAALQWSESHRATQLLPGGDEDLFRMLKEWGYFGVPPAGH